MTKKKLILLIMVLLVGTLTLSGCIKNSHANNTWGEKHISLDSIIITNTTGNQSEDDSDYYLVQGSITNKNDYNALNVKIKVIGYDKKSNIISINNTPYISSKELVKNRESFFYASLYDPSHQIVSFKVELVDAQAEYLI